MVRGGAIFSLLRCYTIVCHYIVALLWQYLLCYYVVTLQSAAVLFFLYYVVTLLPYWPRYYFICYNVLTLLPVVPLFLRYLSLRCYVIASGAIIFCVILPTLFLLP